MISLLFSLWYHNWQDASTAPDWLVWLGKLLLKLFHVHKPLKWAFPLWSFSWFYLFLFCWIGAMGLATMYFLLEQFKLSQGHFLLLFFSSKFTIINTMFIPSSFIKKLYLYYKFIIKTTLHCFIIPESGHWAPLRLLCVIIHNFEKPQLSLLWCYITRVT